MFSDFDFNVIYRSLSYLFLDGMTFTITLTVLATLIGVTWGTALALMRLSGFPPLVLFAAGYVNLMRSVPLVLMIFWFYFLVPYIGQWITGSANPMRIGAFASSLITFALFEAAFFSEIMRAGIQSVSRGQTAAAQALGMNYPRTMAYVVLPQAFRNMVPVLLLQCINLFKSTSLVYVVGVRDFLTAAEIVGTRDHQLTELYVFAALVYFTLCFGGARLVKRLERRYAL